MGITQTHTQGHIAVIQAIPAPGHTQSAREVASFVTGLVSTA